jgi:hypothetical protein
MKGNIWEAGRFFARRVERRFLMRLAVRHPEIMQSRAMQRRRTRRMRADARLVTGRRCAVCGHVVDGYEETFTIQYGGDSWGINSASSS